LSVRLRRAAAATSTWLKVDDGGRIWEEGEEEEEEEEEEVDLGPELAKSTRSYALKSWPHSTAACIHLALAAAASRGTGAGP